jgi:hypothetical protein
VSSRTLPDWNISIVLAGEITPVPPADSQTLLLLIFFPDAHPASGTIRRRSRAISPIAGLIGAFANAHTS